MCQLKASEAERVNFSLAHIVFHSSPQQNEDAHSYWRGKFVILSLIQKIPHKHTQIIMFSQIFWVFYGPIKLTH